MSEPTKRVSLKPIKFSVLFASLAFFITILYPIVLSLILSNDTETNNWGWAVKRSFSDSISNFTGSVSFFTLLTLIALPILGSFYRQLHAWSWYAFAGVLAKETTSGVLSTIGEIIKYKKFKSQLYNDYQSFNFYDPDILLSFHFVLFILVTIFVGSALYFCFSKESLMVFKPIKKWIWVSMGVAISFAVLSFFILNSFQ